MRRPTTSPSPNSSSPPISSSLVDHGLLNTRDRQAVGRQDGQPLVMRASITLRAEPAELTRLQAFADGFAHQCGLPDDERSRLLIILEELFTNAVTHGHGPYPAGGTIAVALGWKTGRLRVSFVDDGLPFDPLA